jgi:hypothetical protein
VTIGGLNEVKVFRTSDFSQVATIPVGALPHGIWPSGDGNRVYVGLENGDGVTVILDSSVSVRFLDYRCFELELRCVFT